VLKKIALALVAIVLLLVAVVAMQPSSFAVERSLTMAAPPEVVYEHIENLRAFDVWNPFSKMDPQMKTSYAGPEAGVGASSSWEGPEMGKGSMTITAVKPDREVEIRLDFLAPMEATNHARFTLTPADGGTRVTWRMEGTNNFVGKAFSLVVDMDEMVGGEFAKGLESMKVLAEADARKRAASSPGSAG
jgi:uncharacterized protein YndB with AHSA1/START domain